MAQDVLSAGDYPKVKSVDRALDLFELLAGWNREMTHTEIGRSLNIPKSSLTQIIGNLTARGYLSFNPETQCYRLGDALTKLTRRLSTPQRLADIAAPLLEKLKQITGESAMVQEMIDGEGVVTASIMSDHALVTHMRVGERAPLHTMSGGKVLLAHLPEAALDEYVTQADLTAVTEHSIVVREDLRQHLHEVRREGFGYSLQELTAGVDGIGAPVITSNGRAVGAISVVMPTLRHTPAAGDLIRAALLDATAEAAALMAG